MPLLEIIVEQIAKKLIFTGYVQGVGFRFTAYNIANRNQITGLVRNLPNGSVEIIAQGHPDDIDDCIRDIKESFVNAIKNVQVEHVPVDNKLKEFKITF